MSSNVVTDTLTSQFAAIGGVMLLAGILPFVASWMLDGVVQLLRRNGPKLFLMGLGFTVLAGGGGYFALQYGLGIQGVPVDSTSAMKTLAQTILMFTIPLALIAFVIRTVKRLVKSR
ncbi:hypothetical protein E3T55_10215 [Cryobacterium frigoriphilum]|uniref:MotA/TolQ/ExbB proton channel domain-containing protein n=1 Tax=Cryobacterium frigoriphilum TaxID=1259150 RepID=A0A4V3IR99_9MICO|nr:hypothetical protein [Cryobacterium frigoriphilum]TFD50268.1 hypothetical protein E3T55_10215 [Cryobacterium frigoriphilum]